MNHLSGDQKEFYMSLFMDIVKEYPILFCKSMLPEVQQKKSAALTSVKNKCEIVLDGRVTEKEIHTKLSNSKTRLRKKLKLKRDGSTAVKLNRWERKLYALMQTDVQSVLKKDEEATSCGEKDGPSTTVNTCPEEACQSSSVFTILVKPDVSETDQLSASDWQRMILLQQHTALKEQKKCEEKLERLADEKNDADTGDKVENRLEEMEFVSVKQEPDCGNVEEITIKEEPVEDDGISEFLRSDHNLHEARAE